MRNKKVEEIFRKIPGYEDYYVSTLGRVLSSKLGDLRFIKPATNKKYPSIALHANGKITRYGIHQLVAMAFMGYVPTKGYTVDHINNISDDNRLENLQILTNRENVSKDIPKQKAKYKDLPIGVYWYKQGSKYGARIMAKGKRKHLGYYATPEEAGKAYQKYKKENEL
jgi:hypothetical protein